MSAVFPRWCNSAFRRLLLLVALSAVAAPLALMGWVRTEYVTGQFVLIEQPIPFDHRHHVVDDGIDCRYCHRIVEVSSRAGIPSTEVCMNCHSQVWNDSPLLAPVRESFFENEPIAWARVHRLPDFVYFDHSAHVTNGIGCESCHGRVDTMARVFQVAPLTMAWCLDCHRNPESHLRPPGAITAMGWTPKNGGTAARAALRDYYRTNPSTNCTTCHR